MKRWLYAAVSTAAIAAALTAVSWQSSPGRSPDGPFGPSGTVTENAACIPIPGRIITYGAEAVRNDGRSEATIQKIGYVHPHNLKVLDAFVVPPRGDTLYGGRPGYPPEWMLAERSMTVRFAHGTAMDDYANVILVTRLTGQAGHADAVYLDYEDNGTLYYFRTITSLTVKHGDGVRTGVCH